MNKYESIMQLQHAITDLMIINEVTDFRWATENERGVDETYDACLIIDGNAHLYCWDHDGLSEMNEVSIRYGYEVELLNYIDIGFYRLMELKNGGL